MKKSSVRISKSSDALNGDHRRARPTTTTITPPVITIGHEKYRSEPMLVQPSLHPWYYVKGRPDLTEQRISHRRERDDQRHRQSVANDQYFARRAAESQVHRRWADDKSLVKHKPMASDVRPPYDVLPDDKPVRRRFANERAAKEADKQYKKSKDKLKEFLDSFTDFDVHSDQLDKRQAILVFQLNELKKIRTHFADRQELFDLKVKHMANQRSNRVKLRGKCFYIVDQLHYHKNCVKSIQNLPDFEKILDADELIQLRDVMDRAIKIIDMYIEVNENRNNEFQLMYDEEADNRWEPQDNEWCVEYEVWNVMIEKLMDSYKNILKQKLTKVLTEEMEALEERERRVKELTGFTAKLKADPYLCELLTENVYDFGSEDKED